VPGDNNLLNPYLRTDISDPLGYLIESGEMSPYQPEDVLVSNYADAQVQNLVLNDSTVAARFSEYRNNRVLMSGAGADSLPSGRVNAAGSGVVSASNTRALGASASFSGVTALAPFAAGSSALAHQSASSGMSGFDDPNALVMAATSSATLSRMQGDVATGGADTTASAGLVSGGSEGAAFGDAPVVYGAGVGELTTQMPGADAATFSALASAPVGLLVRAPDSTVIGPAPGEVFPDVSMAIQSTTGFPDSTMGTAGIKYQTETPEISPLEQPPMEFAQSPFPGLSSESTEFLHPTLFPPLDEQEQTGSPEPPMSLDEFKRKAKLKAMIDSPGTPLPSPFEERALERAYLEGKRSHRKPSRYPSTFTAPSIKP
jgi:hypothetical protein